MPKTSSIGWSAERGQIGGVRTLTMTGDISLDANSATVQRLAPNGASRLVTLWADPIPGAFRVISNTGTTNTITIRNASLVTVAVLSAGMTAAVVFDGSAWFIL